MDNPQDQISLPAEFRIEGYQILKVLGKGGFGITYLAQDIDLGLKVAIKELLPDGIAMRGTGCTVIPITIGHKDEFEWARDAFIEEARTLAKFKHPNIVGVHRVIQANETVYCVMEYVEGDDLGKRLSKSERDRLPLEDVREIILQLANGLEEVHRNDVLHRDIKPDNIIITEKGVPILLDFGAARQGIAEKSRSVTSIVTPGYAPFEQYSGDPQLQGPWTDLYALGAVCYRCLLGEKPTDSSQRANARLKKKPDPVEKLAKIIKNPDRAELAFLRAIDRALEVDEDKRPRTVAEWRGLFEHVVADSPESKDPAAVGAGIGEAIGKGLKFGASAWTATKQNVARQLEAASAKIAEAKADKVATEMDEDGVILRKEGSESAKIAQDAEPGGTILIDPKRQSGAKAITPPSLPEEREPVRQPLPDDDDDDETAAEALAKKQQEEEERLARKKAEEEERKAREEERLAKKKAEEEERQARKKAAEEEKLAKKKAEEEARLAKKKAEEGALAKQQEEEAAILREEELRLEQEPEFMGLVREFSKFQPFVVILGIVGLLVSGFFALGATVMILGGVQEEEAPIIGFGSFLGVLAIILFSIVLSQFQMAISIGRAKQAPKVSSLNKVLKKQRLVWAGIGTLSLLTAISLTIGVIVIVFQSLN
tara:strand:+ start:3754 stop:5721 length:1968 start_codon:yes stop_codon:yes gene_type:complete